MPRFALAFACTAVCLLVLPARSDTPESARLLPKTTAFFAEIAEPAELIDTIASHPVLAKVQKTQRYRDATATPQYVVGRIVLGSIEAKLEQKWQPALKAAFGGGVTLAIDAETNGAVIIARAEDPASLERLVKVLTQLAREDAKGKGKPDPIEEDVYRDITVYRLDKAAFALHDGTFVATNNGDVGRFVLDRLLDAGGETLAEQPTFQQACAARTGDSTLWMFADMQPIRAAAGEKSPLKTGRTENFIVELLVGGEIDVLRKTAFVTAAVDLTAEALAVNIASPFDHEWVTEARDYFFESPAGDENQNDKPVANARVPGEIGQTLLSINTHRDVSMMWLRAGDLFEQKHADDLAKAESGLSTFFGGKDFGEDVLGALGPRLQVVVARQELPEGVPQPAVRLPAFAVVGTLKDADTMRSEFRRTFLSLVGFLNVIGAMEGRPQLDFEVSKEGDDQVIVTRYVVEADRIDEEQAPIYFNFSPSIAFVDDQMVIASTEKIARELVVALRQPATPPRVQPNSTVELDVPPVHALLVDNREQLIAQNMLSKGHDRQEAEREIDLLLTLLDMFQDVRLTLTTAEDQMELHLDVRAKE